MALIYKILPAQLWREAQASGKLIGAPVDLADGYIHFSSAEQVVETAARHFALQDNLVLLAVETERLDAALRWEVSRNGALFPHLYAPLRIADVAFAHPLPLLANGQHDFSGLLP
ncbi:MAG: DUF952 domain-containing protein [Hyphomicrobiales bacterium]|nr:DUF952 domain-containing protein [Hyphomicrobiales bacterium]MDE2115217.1 DUF952 domain-containing protein [Hyphomicrobiales bacterium]